MRSLRLPAVLAVSLVAAGCAGEASESADSEEGKLGSSSESAAAASRASCKFHRGAMPSETVGKELPLGDAMPIENIVVIMQENRSFDSYFGHLNKYAHRTDIESAPEDTTNPEKVNTPGSPRQRWRFPRLLSARPSRGERERSETKTDSAEAPLPESASVIPSSQTREREPASGGAAGAASSGTPMNARTATAAPASRARTPT